MRMNKYVFSKIAFTAVMLSVLSLSLSHAVELSNVKALIKVKKEIAANPDSVVSHRKYQDLMIKEGWRDQMVKEYTERSEGARTPENLYLLVRLKEKEEQIRGFKEISEEFPDFAWGLYGHAFMTKNSGDNEGAVKLYERILEIDPSFAKAYEQLGRIYYNGFNDIVKADEWIRKGMDAVPDDPDILSLRGYFMLESKYYNEALDAAEKSLKYDPKNWLSMKTLGTVLIRKRRFKEAISVNEKFLSLWPGNIAVEFNIVKAHFGMYDKEKDPEMLAQAKQMCEELLAKDPAKVYAYYVEMYTFFSDREWWVHALYYNNRAFKMISSDDGNYSAFEHNRGWIPSTKLAGGYRLEAVAPSVYVRSQGSSNPNENAVLKGIEDPGAWEHFSSIMKNDGEPGMEELDALIERFPEFSPAYYDRGILQMKKRNNEEAVIDLEKAVSLSPEWGRAHGALAVAYIRMRQFEDARTAIKTAAELDPDDHLVRYNADFMRMFDEAVVEGTIEELRDIARAVKDGGGPNLGTFAVFAEPFARYLKRDPANPDIQEAFGDIFFASSNSFYRKSALTYYNKAIELGGNVERLIGKISEIEHVE